MKPIQIVFAFLCFTSCAMSAQNIVISEDPQITKMMSVYVGGATTPTANPNTGTASATTPSGNNANVPVQILDGFRLQIMASTDRRAVENGQNSFAAKYPTTFNKWVQAQPYYRLRIGAFATRSEALRYLQVIKKDYPDAYVVPDKIKNIEITQF